MSAVEERFAKNEAAFRAVNERIEELAQQYRRFAAEESVQFVCECSRNGCMAPLELTRAEYEHARSSARWFIISPGHEDLEIEHVVERNETHTLVEKLGEAGQIA